MEQPVPPDGMTEESGVNTDPDWESQLVAMSEYSSSLVEKYNRLMRQQEEENVTQKKEKEQLQKKKEEAIRQHQALLEKLGSVRVKLLLNNSKATKKNFLHKKEEMTLEKNKAEEEKNRLAKELEEKEKQLTALLEEQTEEQQKCQEELKELKQEMEQVQKEVQEATQLALEDEVTAVEKQRDVAMAHIETWLKEVEQHLNVLRVQFPQQYPHERQNWQKKISLVLKNQVELQKRFEEVLQNLQQGQTLESIPRIVVPSLPQAPTLLESLAHPRFMPPPEPIKRPLPPQGHFQQQQYPPPQHPQYHQRYRPPPPHYFHPPPPSQPEYLAQTGVSSRLTPPRNHSPSPPVQPTHPAAPSPPPHVAASATSILEKLGTRFPQYNTTELKTLLKQVKSSRGTLAGMSIDEATEQIQLLSARNETTPGPISRPMPHSQVQRPPASMHKPAGGGHTGGPRKFCLMCQNLVDRESRYPLNCSHTIHKDCIQTWLQSSKNNPCPFCRTKS
ncbi:hypothetical protein D4764_05G0008800 [Takifugu flavidus]|uniref:RING-type domain-containing protein n=2 Tax=Takifugu flavidus TaxID=433684 RepID=A0A5C6N4Z5_9TELE|nr:hypothetical protein D4764_05G0008800 [Takifugu flavidus]